MSDEPTPDEVLATASSDLVEAVDATMVGWVARSVEALVLAHRGEVAAEVVEQATRSGEQARSEIMPRLRAMLDADIDEQRANPLDLLRDAVVYPTEVLRRQGVPEVVRDDFDERQFPEDVYGISPASFSDVDPSLHEPGLRWGAAKAHAHLARRRPS